MLSGSDVEKLQDEVVRAMVGPKRITTDAAVIDSRCVDDLIKAAQYLEDLRRRMKDTGRPAHAQ